MGWNPQEGYYQKHVKVEGYPNKIADRQEMINKLPQDDVATAISFIAEKIDKEERTYSLEQTEEIEMDFLYEYAKSYDKIKKMGEQQEESEKAETQEQER